MVDFVRLSVDYFSDYASLCWLAAVRNCVVFTHNSRAVHFKSYVFVRYRHIEKVYNVIISVPKSSEIWLVSKYLLVKSHRNHLNLQIYLLPSTVTKTPLTGERTAKDHDHLNLINIYRLNINT